MQLIYVNFSAVAIANCTFFACSSLVRILSAHIQHFRFIFRRADLFRFCFIIIFSSRCDLSTNDFVSTSFIEKYVNGAVRRFWLAHTAQFDGIRCAKTETKREKKKQNSFKLHHQLLFYHRKVQSVRLVGDCIFVSILPIECKKAFCDCCNRWRWSQM